MITEWGTDIKIYIVPSSLFRKGLIMSPFRLEQERDALIRQKAELERRLDGMPERIALLDKQRTEALIDFVPFKGTK